jgi:hypothetical protein
LGKAGHMARIDFGDPPFASTFRIAVGGRAPPRPFARQEDAMFGLAKAGLLGAALIGAIAAATPAFAAIKCQDGNQLIQGNWMATPYCQDALLAQVANARGFTTTFAAIRNNPNHKKELCRFLYTDIRVQMTCMDAGVPEYYGGGR